MDLNLKTCWVGFSLLQDLSPPEFLIKNTSTKSTTAIGFSFDSNGKYIREQGILQSIFPNEKNSLKNYTGPLILSFSHIIQNIDPKALVFIYVNIRYVDGRILPVWVFADVKNHADWKDSCIYVPYYNNIDDIQLSVGGCDMKQNFSNPEVLLTNLHVDMVDNENTSFDEIKKTKGECRILQRIPQLLKTEIAVYKAQYTPAKHDLTIVTQLSSERMLFLEENLKRHKGSYSVAVYLKEPQDAMHVQQIWSNNAEMRKYCDLHLIYSHPYAEEDNPRAKRFSFHYPVNYLRNIARKYATTEFILYIDVDFVLPSTLAKDTENGKIVEYYRQIDPSYKSLILFPTFYSWAPEHSPTDRKSALKMLKTKEINKFVYQSQEINDYEKWEKQDGPEFWEVTNLFLLSEPYFIAPRDTPLFNERFIGCGRDKLQQSVVLHHLGFKFWVWKQAFITHIPVIHLEKKLQLKSICDSFPPASIGYHSFASHYVMMFEEMTKYNRIDFENRETKQTVLKVPSEAHDEWTSLFEKYVDKNLPHLALKKPIASKKKLTPKPIQSKKPKPPKPVLPKIPEIKPPKVIIKKEVKVIYEPCKKTSSLSFWHMIAFGVFELLLFIVVISCFFRRSSQKKKPVHHKIEYD
eukprot:gene12070-5563_t